MDTATSARITAIVIDCLDSERLAEFWSEVLGLPVERRRGPYVWFRIGDRLVLGLQQVHEPKRQKNRMHIDVAVDDVEATARRIIALGGSRLPGYEDGGFLVMADPEGNEFCVLPNGDWKMDDEGRADYLGQ